MSLCEIGEQTFASQKRKSVLSADCEFDHILILHMQRMAGMRIATAASEAGVECLLLAVNSHGLHRRYINLMHCKERLERAQNSQCCKINQCPETSKSQSAQRP